MLLREWVDTCGITHVTRAGARTELLSTGSWQQRHLYQLETNYVLQFHPGTQSWVPDFTQMTRPRSHQVLLTQELRFMLIFIYNKQFVRHIQLTAVLMCYRLKRFFLIKSQSPHGLRRGSAASRLLVLRVRIPPSVLTSVSCECCVLSGRGRSLVQRNPTVCVCVWHWLWPGWDKSPVHLQSVGTRCQTKERKKERKNTTLLNKNCQ